MKRYLLAPIALAALTGTSGAASLSLDFQPTGGTTAAGFQAFEGTNQDPTVTATDTYAAFGGSVTVTLVASNLPNTPDDFRAVTRNGADSATNVANDWLGVDTRAGGVDVTMTITLAGLPAGLYNWSSGHHDGGVTGGPASSGNIEGLADYIFNDATGSSGLVANGINLSRELDAETPSIFSYDFTSDGSDVVVQMLMDEGQGDVGDVNPIFIHMNSLVISEIPEPSAGILAGLGLLGLLRRRR